MILREVTLHPFAGISRRTVSFRPGLNVIVGPNEAGKSTLVQAIQLILFQRVLTSAREFRNRVAPFLPAGGGDTIRVTLLLEQDGEYQVSKSWGAEKQARMTLPDGSVVSDDATVQEILQRLTGYHQATYQHVLIVQQNRLTETWRALQQESAPRNDLNNLLRRAVFETGGVSIEKLEQMIEERYHQLFSHWDARLNLPAGNRGIRHPWQKEVGEILQAYYELETIRENLHQVEAFEQERDRLNARVEQMEREVQEIREFVETHHQQINELRERALLEERLQRLEQEENRLRDINQQWPVLEQRIRETQPKVEELNQRLSALLEEKSRVEKAQELQEKLKLWQEVEKREKEIHRLNTEKNRLSPVSEPDVKRLREIDRERSQLSATLKAASLQVQLKTRVPEVVQVQIGLEPEQEIHVSPKEPHSLTASGSIRIKHDNLEVTVVSGELNVEAVQRSLQALQREEMELLAKCQIENLEQGEAVLHHHRELDSQLALLKDQLNQLLGGHNREELQALAEQAEDVQSLRSLSAVMEDISSVQMEKVQMESRLEETQEQIRKWQEEFHNPEKLLDRLIELRQERKSVQGKLEQLAQPPEGVESVEVFIRMFEEKEQQLRDQESQLSELRIRKAEMDAREPDESSETLRERLRELEAAFQQKLRLGRAMEILRKRFIDLKTQMDGETLQPWVNRFVAYLRLLTGERYQEVQLKEGVPEKVVRKDGVALQVDWLSVGAKDGLALALRLSMAEYFLRERRGFLIMDDPLVDLDPERQQAAVELLRQFARSHQLIVLTCHPHHAELLGGNQVNLEGEL